MANGYKKIGGGGRSGRLAFTQIALWEGPDHLLQVERDGYKENYKRFYFSDIQSMTIRRDKRQQNFAIFFVIVLAILTWIFLVTGGFGRGFTTFWIIFFLVPALYNWVRGPTCVTHISTAVQNEELKSLSRVRYAERVLNRILEGAQGTQGVLSPDMARIRFELRNAPPGSTPPPLSPGPLP